MLSLLVDGLIVVLLLAMLGRGLRLQRNLRDLRPGDGELERLIAALDRASARAEAALAGLRQTAEATGERLEGQLASAQRLLDDLRFLAGRGEQVADRLEAQIRKERPAAQLPQLEPPQPQPQPPAPSRPPPPGAARPAMPAADLERTLRTLR